VRRSTTLVFILLCEHIPERFPFRLVQPVANFRCVIGPTKARHLAAVTMAVVLFGYLGRAPGADVIQSSNLHNAFAVTPKIFSGGSPDNEAGFAEIAKLGVKTIISVDGGKPDLETAKKYGLKYVHLPFGYDSIPTNRVAELVKAAQALPGPFYVHCHHGQHRGPAAVAVICEATAGWSTNRAVEWLQQAGTAVDYPGLYRSARDFKPPSAAELAAVEHLPELARTSSLIDSMVAIDERMERLGRAQNVGWRSVPGPADIQPSHEATLLWEQFRELARFIDGPKRPEDYRSKLVDAVQSADRFRTLLQQEPVDGSKTGEAFKKVSQSCVACHQQYRN
jgi:protein tyrosine phosphatase (PTP) superfamily phosphohydrolase (DUF442 family)